MRMNLLAVSILGGVALLTGCGAAGTAQGDKASVTVSREAAVTPMAELKGISTDLNAGITELTKPVDDAEAAIDELVTLPKRHGLTPSDITAMARGAFTDGTFQLTLSTDLAVEIKEEVEASLLKFANAVMSLKQTPDRVSALLAKAAEATARVPLLATKITASATATASNPFGAAAAKKQAQADLAELKQVQTDTMKAISDVQAKIAGIPTLATRTLAKASKSFFS